MTLQIVILSEVEASRSDSSTQSKACPELAEGDPLSLNGCMSPGKAFSPRSGLAFAVALFAVALLLTTLAAAQTLTGTVTNATTNQPAAGDEVVLLKLGQGMEEAGRTKTDAKGKFSFKLDDAQSPHLVRAIHQDVTYHRMAPPGTTSVELQVYDVGKKIEGISVVADIMRVQTEPGKLDIMRAFAVQNASDPKRTQMNERSLEFYVPEGAKVIDGSAMTAGGQPISSMPIAEGEKNRYSFIFPLRPGISQFQVAYQIPYSGSANLDPKSPYPLEHFVAILPKTMQFAAAATTAGFKPMNDPNQPDSIVQVASNTKIGQNLAFKVSGQGTLEERQDGEKGQGGQQSSGAEQSSAQANNRPGGGLGPPIDAPDPLQKYQWWILGGLAAALVVGGVYVASRQQSAARALRQKAASAPASAKSPTMQLEIEDDYPPSDLLATPAPSTIRSTSAARPTSMLLEGLKEELFQLEIERRQGQISQSEYEKAKSALDQTLERALKREAQKA